jgi:hypothetical protein
MRPDSDLAPAFDGMIALRRHPYEPFLFRTTEPLSYYGKKEVHILPGLVTDGASIPRALWRLVGSPFAGRYLAPAIIHDGLYAAEALPRRECDALFLEAMQETLVSSWRARTMYWAVRAGGWVVWRRHTQASIDTAKQFVQVITP